MSEALMGYKGNSFVNSGYVYAPYVPLQTTPTIFGGTSPSRHSPKINGWVINPVEVRPTKSRCRSIFDSWEPSKID